MYNLVKIYDLNRPTNATTVYEKTVDLTPFKGNVTSVGFKNHDKIIYTSCEDGFLKIFDLRAKNIKKEMKQNKPINCAIITPN
jgi:WD40 repeat protein